MATCDDYDADEEGGIWGAYSVKIVSGRLLVFVFMTRVWRLLVTSFARLL